MKILYGTTNQAKLASMKRITKSLGIEIIGLNDLGKPLPEVEENGNNPLENAEIKARAYYEAFAMPVFSCDSGLYFDDLEEALQPGIHVRRVNGKELTDEEMREYYSGLAREHGGKLVGRYRNAIFFIVDGEKCFSSMDEKLDSEPFLLVTKAHERRVKGFPLDSLSVDIESGEYYYDIKDKSVDKSAIEEGFKEFFENILAEIQRDSSKQ